jgi:hypothetical protein
VLIAGRGWSQGGGAEEDGLVAAGLAQQGGSVLDRDAFLVAELGQLVLHRGDHLAVAADFLLLGHGPGGSAHGDAGFAGAEKFIEPGQELGQVGDVAFEVAAACALVADRALLAAGFDVAGLLAQPVGDGDGTQAGSHGRIDAGCGARPEPVPVNADLLHGVDRLAQPGTGDLVVTLGRHRRAVIHEFLGDIQRGSGIGEPLRVGVAEGVRVDPQLGEGPQFTVVVEDLPGQPGNLRYPGLEPLADGASSPEVRMLAVPQTDRPTESG